MLGVQHLLDEPDDGRVMPVDLLLGCPQRLDFRVSTIQNRGHRSIEQISHPFAKAEQLPPRGVDGHRRHVQQHRIQFRSHVRHFLRPLAFTDHPHDQFRQQIREG